MQWNRLLLIGALTTVLGGGPTLGWAASGQPPASMQEIDKRFPKTSVEMSLVKVSEHAYYVQGAAGMATDNEGFISNAGVVITPEGVVLFDALGTPALAELLADKIAAVTDQPIVKVVVSHYHADHIYGLQVFKRLGAEIIAPAGAQEYLDSPQATERLEERRMSLDPWVNDDTRLVEPDRFISEGESFSLGGVKFLINVVGAAHSDGDLTLYVVDDKVLFSGDIIFEGRIAYIGDANTKRWLDTLQRMETDQLEALIPGHGPAADKPNEAIASTRDYLAFMRDKMGEAVDQLTPFAQAYEETDWSRFEQLPAFDAANRRNAYAVYLSMEKELLSGQ